MTFSKEELTQLVAHAREVPSRGDWDHDPELIKKLALAVDQLMTSTRREMWFNAFTVVTPSDELALEVGKEVLGYLKQSAGRVRGDLEPMFDVNIRLYAS